MNKTFSRILTATLLGAALVSAAGMSTGTTSARTPGSTPYVYTFDQTTNPWQARSASPMPNPVTLNVQREVCPSPIGCNSYAAMRSSTDAWMSATFPATMGHVNVTFQMKNLGGCKGCMPVAYVGTNQPSSLQDFQKLGGLMRTDGWGTYTLDADINMGLSTQMVVAVGYFNNGIFNPAVIGIDNIVISTGK